MNNLIHSHNFAFVINFWMNVDKYTHTHIYSQKNDAELSYEQKRSSSNGFRNVLNFV
jgi:hypothetical protein